MRYVLAALVALVLTGCGSDPVDPAIARNSCLFEAVRAYPSWDTGNGPLLDHVDSCTGQDKTLVRQMMSEFVAAANTNSEGK